MSPILRALHAEELKLRNTLALWLCILTPLIVVVFGTAMVWVGPFMLAKGTPNSHWEGLIQTILSMWAVMMLPLFVTLEAALLASLEHGNNQWKHLLVLPLPRKTHYIAKLLTLIALVLLATLSLCFLVTVGGLLMEEATTNLLAGSPPWGFLVGHALASLAAASLMIALQCFISIHWRSFSLAMASGITATMIAIFIPKGGPFNAIFPWALPSLAVNGTSQQIFHVVTLSIVGGIFVSALSVWVFCRRDYT